MRRIEFDYGNTCPRIDKEIAKVKGEIEGFVDNLLEEACPLLGTLHRKDLASGYAQQLYDAIEDAFETVRSTNEEMRREAERQIGDLADRIANLEHDLEAAS